MSLLDSTSSRICTHRKQQQQQPIELMSLVGEGIYGKVYKARWHHHDDDYHHNNEDSKADGDVRCYHLHITILYLVLR